MNSDTTQKQLSEKDVIQVLHFIIEKIGTKDIIRRFDGGVNLLIRGMPRLPTDIDIRTNKAGYEAFNKEFLKMKKKEGQSKMRETLGKKQYSIFNIQGMDVEVAYYEKEIECMDMFSDIIKKTRNGITIPVLPLAQIKHFYEWIGSTEKMKLIENFLSQNK